MKKKIFMSAAKKARIALAVMAVCGFALAGAQSAFAENVTIDDKKNIICGEGATASRNPLQKDDGTNIVVIGNNATGIGSETIAIGYNAKAEGEYSIAFGSSAYAFYGGVSIGDLSETTYGAVAIGLRAKGSGRDSVAIGKDAKAEGQDSLAIADSSVAKGEKSVALGYQAKAAGEKSIAMGYRSSAEAKGSFALGSDSSVTKENSVAIGTGSVANRNNSVSVGSGGSEYYGPQYRQIINVAYGTDKNDAATYGQILRDTWSTIKIDDDGNGSTKLTKNDGTQGPTINVDASSLNKKITRNTNSITAVDNKIGSLSADGNYIKKANNVSQNLSVLDNKVKTNEGAITAVDNKIGSLSADGNYIKKANKVAQNLSAIDEQVFKNETAIGTLSSLTTNEKTNLVGAVNEVKGTADTALGLANTNKANIGTLTNLTTTEKGNLVGAINEVKGSVDAANTAIAGKADLDLGNISTAGETKIKDLASIKAGEVVADKLGAITSTNYVSASGKVNANISVLDKQVKANADDIIAANTKITNVDNKIGSLSTDGTYIKKANNVSANLVELDKQVNTNATAITNKANLDLSNINAAGENVIKNLAGNKAGEIVDTKLGNITSENYVKKADTVNANISALDTQVKANADDIIAANTKITAVDNKIGSLSADGNYIKKANNVSANLVELDNQVNANATAITNKANLDLSNINAAGENVIKNLAGNKAGEIVDVKLGAITSTHYVTTGNTVNANISALDTQLNKVDNKIGTMTDGNYISAGNTVAGNLSALDNQLKANTDAINTKADKDLSNITDAGKNVIKDLAGNKAGEIVDTKLGDITSENYVKKDDTVNANISALDKQVKANADAINTKADKDLSNITDAGKNVIKDLAGNKAGEVVDAKLGDITSENYVKKDDTVNANISALDKQMKANADDIITANTKITNVDNKIGDLAKLDTAEKGNLVGAVNEVNKKADKNTEDIKNVNGRVDELGGRVDTLGGAVSKLDTKVNKVGAGAAALAALHPMDFDPDNKLTFAAGVGNYRGANAAAIGAFYRPNEQVMFSIAGNMGNGENMVNAGVSFALDRPSQTPTTKAALVKTVAAQNEQIAALNETVAEQNEKIARLEAMVEKLVAKQNA
ncbi:YadA-like family protein [Phascolarctobacterium succinatutens]|uniref:YadA-like family protein n=1 Tax=Phascolarctobacterium succinatutens TaxID=626940 RepID=UPI0026F35C30|nr:YadA-like family protein [Phascolarctobacterium succinatutens]